MHDSLTELIIAGPMALNLIMDAFWCFSLYTQNPPDALCSAMEFAPVKYGAGKA